MIMWWQLELAANATISVAYFCIAAMILVPLVQVKQLWANKLATATAAIFFSCAVGHGLHAVQALLSGLSAATTDDGMSMTGHGTGTWWLAVCHTLTAVIGVYYLTLRRFYGRLLTPAPLFQDLAEQQRVQDLEAFRAEATARLAAEGERDRYAQMLHSINSNSDSLVYVKDLDGRYLMVNAAFEQTFDVQAAELVGKSDEVLDPELAPTWQEADRKALAGSYRLEESIQGSEGLRYFSSVKFPLVDGAGELYATCGISTEVTESKLQNLALSEARDIAVAATAAKSAFLATMSHEIRTPLNAVIGMTDLLLDTRLDEQQNELVDTVRSSSDSLLAVINDVLDFSKIEAGELRLASDPFHLRRLVEGTLDLVATSAAAKNLDLVSYVEDGCPVHVVGDAPHLRQILLNLLSNAVKFTEAGEVLLTVAGAPAGDRLEVTITVTDTGIGISPAGLTKLFQSFSQVDDAPNRSYGGTGLGLAISQRLAQAMGGDVTVASVVDEGSTFTVTVLLDRGEDAGEPDDLRVSEDPSLIDVSVLIVDDNVTNLRILDLQLSRLNMTTTTATSPAEALALVQDGLRYDLAVLDYNMPEMTGLELAAALSQLSGSTASPPTILLSSMASRPPVDLAQVAVLIKPVKLEALRAALASALHGNSSAGAGAARSEGLRPNGRPLKILLAEDNPVNQRVAQLMLNKLGHDITIVDNGRAAVDAVSADSYDVVLMDVQMPKMDGLEATRTIRTEVPAARQPHIIAMTASAMLEDQQACSAAGMESFLTKPVRAQDLKAMLTRVSATIRSNQSGGEKN